MGKHVDEPYSDPHALIQQGTLFLYFFACIPVLSLGRNVPRKHPSSSHHHEGPPDSSWFVLALQSSQSRLIRIMHLCHTEVHEPRGNVEESFGWNGNHLFIWNYARITWLAIRFYISHLLRAGFLQFSLAGPRKGIASTIPSRGHATRKSLSSKQI